MVQPNNQINPREIQATVNRSGKAQTVNPTFDTTMANAAGSFAGEATAQATGNVNAAAVLNAAFSSVPAAAGTWAGGSNGMYGGMMPGDSTGILGASRYSTVNPGVGGAGGAGDTSGLGMSQAQLIDKMNSNNLQLLGLQATLQNNMQSWTTKSNVLKSDYDARMAMIQKFSVHG